MQTNSGKPNIETCLELTNWHYDIMFNIRSTFEANTVILPDQNNLTEANISTHIQTHDP